MHRRWHRYRRMPRCRRGRRPAPRRHDSARWRPASLRWHAPTRAAATSSAVRPATMTPSVTAHDAVPTCGTSTVVIVSPAASDSLYLAAAVADGVSHVLQRRRSPRPRPVAAAAAAHVAHRSCTSDTPMPASELKRASRSLSRSIPSPNAASARSWLRVSTMPCVSGCFAEPVFGCLGGALHVEDGRAGLGFGRQPLGQRRRLARRRRSRRAASTEAALLSNGATASSRSPSGSASRAALTVE